MVIGMNEKNELRIRILNKRRQMPNDLLKEKSLYITRKILESQYYQEAKRIFTFISMSKEVDTTFLITQAWNDKKEVFVPVTESEGRMYFVPYLEKDELFKTKLGVWEPKKEKMEQTFPQEKDLFLVPGAVFDEQGNRIGYGGGYYDRYFALGGNYKKIGIAFSFQLLKETIPSEKLDRKVDEVITEKEWIGGIKNESFN